MEEVAVAYTSTTSMTTPASSLVVASRLKTLALRRGVKTGQIVSVRQHVGPLSWPHRQPHLSRIHSCRR